MMKKLKVRPICSPDFSIISSMLKKGEKRRKRGLTEREKGDILRKLSRRGNPAGRLATETFPESGKKKTRKNFKKEVDRRVKEW